VESGLKRYLNALFTYRKRVEPTLSDQMLQNLDNQIDQLLDPKVLKEALGSMLDIEMTNLEAQRNLALRRPELEYEQTEFNMNNTSLYDTLKKNVTNEEAFRKYTLQFARFQWL
jgi:FKBP-type peptidyl-prolyl cis-trans isomerase (trigger factor)